MDINGHTHLCEDYVSYEIAKLLREKGFNIYGYASIKVFGGNTYEVNGEWITPKEDTIIPTLQMAMKWLRKVHSILLVVDYIYECTNTSYVYKIYRLGENGKPEREPVMGVSDKDDKEHIVGYRDYQLSYKDYATYEEATEAGIQYCLENLI